MGKVTTPLIDFGHIALTAQYLPVGAVTTLDYPFKIGG